MKWWEKLLIGILLFVATLPYLIFVQGAIFVVTLPIILIIGFIWGLFAVIFVLSFFGQLLMWPIVELVSVLSRRWWFRVLFMIISCVLAAIILSLVIR